MYFLEVLWPDSYEYEIVAQGYGKLNAIGLNQLGLKLLDEGSVIDARIVEK